MHFSFEVDLHEFAPTPLRLYVDTLVSEIDDLHENCTLVSAIENVHGNTIDRILMPNRELGPRTDEAYSTVGTPLLLPQQYKE